MLNSEDVGDSSSRKRDNAESATNVERPLKKARFAWQIKGQYHLKEQDQSLSEEMNSKLDPVLPKSGDLSSEDSDSTEKTFDNCSDETLYVSEQTLDSEIGNTTEENHLEILGDYLLKQDFNELESEASNTNLLHPFNQLEYLSAATNPLSHNLRCSHVPSSDSDRLLYGQNTHDVRSVDGDHGSSLPTMVTNKGTNVEDIILARWQTRQVAKGFVDNTINRVLDTWLEAPLPPSMDRNHLMALDVAEFLDNLPGSNRIENEGILMAISAHGLQNNFETMRRFPRARIYANVPTSEGDSTTRGSVDSQDSETDRLSDIATRNDKGKSKELTRDVGKNNLESNGSSYSTISSNISGSDEDDDCTNRYNLKKNSPNSWIVRTNVPKNNSGLNFLLPYSTQKPNQEELNLEQDKRDSSGLSKKTDENDDSSISPLSELQQHDETNRSATSENTAEPMYNDVHLDFMDAAISFAIQNKGLTSYGADYG